MVMHLCSNTSGFPFWLETFSVVIINAEAKDSGNDDNRTDHNHYVTCYYVILRKIYEKFNKTKKIKEY